MAHERRWYQRNGSEMIMGALHMPSSAEGTWVLCLNPANKQVAPTYVEPRVVVYLFEMSSVD